MRERNKEDADRLDRSASSLFPPFYVNQLVERDDQPNSSGVLTEGLYVLQDTNYDTIALTDTSVNLVQQYQYDGYGVPTVIGEDGPISSTPGPEADQYGMQYLFQGGRYDAVTGFYHFGARDYDPVNEVWLQQDPAGYPNGANRYEMEGDNPTTRVDPAGLAEESDPIIDEIENELAREREEQQELLQNPDSQLARQLEQQIEDEQNKARALEGLPPDTGPQMFSSCPGDLQSALDAQIEENEQLLLAKENARSSPQMRRRRKL